MSRRINGRSENATHRPNPKKPTVYTLVKCLLSRFEDDPQQTDLSGLYGSLRDLWDGCQETGMEVPLLLIEETHKAGEPEVRIYGVMGDVIMRHWIVYQWSTPSGDWGHETLVSVTCFEDGREEATPFGLDLRASRRIKTALKDWIEFLSEKQPVTENAAITLDANKKESPPPWATDGTGLSAREVAANAGCHPSTVSKEHKKPNCILVSFSIDGQTLYSPESADRFSRRIARHKRPER